MLDRHYSASSLLRAFPPPRTAELARRRVLVEGHPPSPSTLFVFSVNSSFTHAIATTPAGPVESCHSGRSTSSGLPHRSDRSAPALPVSRIAQRSLMLWPACLLTPCRSLFQECFSPFVTSLNRSRCFRLERPVNQAGFAPVRINKTFTAHRPKAVRRCEVPADGSSKKGGYLTLLGRHRHCRCLEQDVV